MPDRREDLQLDRDAVARFDRHDDRRCTSRSASSRSSCSAGSPASSSPCSRSTGSSTTPTSSSPTSTTCSWAAPSSRCSPGIYYWFPKMTGRMLNERLGKISFWLMFIGFNVTFFVQHSLGLSGMPRRIYTYQPGLGWSTYNLISTIGAFILGSGILVTIVNVARNYKHGRLAGPGSVEGQHARVVHALATAGQQLRRDPACAFSRADARHPARDRAPYGRDPEDRRQRTVLARRSARARSSTWVPQWDPTRSHRSWSYGGGHRGFGIDLVALDRILGATRLDVARVGERLQCGNGHVMAVDLEEAPERPSVVAAAEAVGAEHPVRAGTHCRIWSANARM